MRQFGDCQPLTKHYHKQVELGFGTSTTNQGYAVSHPLGIAEHFKAGDYMLADATNLNDNILNGKVSSNVETMQYSMVDQNQNLVGNLTVKMVGGSVLQSNFDNTGSGVGKTYQFKNAQDQKDFSKAKEIITQQ